MFGRESTVVRDSSKLTFEYVPERLLHREEQTRQLSAILRPFAEDGSSVTALAVGPVGTGKTATVKRLCADMMRYGAARGLPLDYVIVNCRQNGTESSALLQLVRHFNPGFPDRGFSPSEMLRSFRAKVESTGRRVVVVLDEADVLLRKGATDIVYQLSRFGEERVNRQSAVSLVMISQERIEGLLDRASLSSFRRTNAVRFPRYVRDELYEIVRARAAEALVDGSLDDGVAMLIAERAAADGDARLAIEILGSAARSAESRPGACITAEDVRATVTLASSMMSEFSLTSLGQQQLAVLLAVARAVRGMPYVQAAAAEKTYAVVCEEYGIRARKHTQFRANLTELRNCNLITMRTVSDPGTGGRTSYIGLPDIQSKTLCRRVEALLEGMQGERGR